MVLPEPVPPAIRMFAPVGHGGAEDRGGASSCCPTGGHDGVEVGNGLRESTDRDDGAVDRGRRDDRMEPRPVRQPCIDGGARLVDGAGPGE